MIFFNLSDYIAAALVMLTFGAVTGGVYPSLRILAHFGKKLLTIPYSALRAKKITDFRHSRSDLKIKRASNVLDFCYFLLIGLTYILLIYVALDAVFRVYTAVILVTAFKLSQKTLGNLFGRFLEWITALVYNASFCIVYTALTPAKVLVRTFYGLAYPLVVKLSQKRQARKFKRLLSKKEKEIVSFFENAERIKE